MDTQYFSVREVAKFFAVSIWKIYELVNTGSIGYTTIGKAIRISKEDIKSYERKNHRPARKKERKLHI